MELFTVKERVATRLLVLVGLAVLELNRIDSLALRGPKETIFEYVFVLLDTCHKQLVCIVF